MKKSAIYQKKRVGSPRWFNRWVQSPAWLSTFGVAVLVCVVVFTVNTTMGRVDPSTTWGIGYGIAAAVLFVAVMVYSVRRRLMRIRRLGRAWVYLQVHVYGGALFLVLMFMHTGFRVPQGVLDGWLWVLSIWVVVSGLLGIVIQKWIPMLLNSGLSTEVHFDRIPELVDSIREQSERQVASGGAALREFYQQKLAPKLLKPRARMIYFFEITGGIQARLQPFRTLRDFLTQDDQERLDALQTLYKTKLELDAHYTLQRALRGWLFLHLPVAVILTVLLGLHIFSVSYY